MAKERDCLNKDKTYSIICYNNYFTYFLKLIS